MSIIFRKAALDKLASPDQLDALMYVTSPRGWLAFGGLFLLLAMVIVWGLVGSLATEIKNSAILLPTGGVKQIVSLQQGQVTELFIQAGDVVAQNQPIAALSVANANEPQPIYSPFAGKILELKADVGSLMLQGDSLASLELVGEGIQEEVIMYVSAAESRQIQPGMPVKLSPHGIPVNQYGYLMGEVISVGKFPLSNQGVLRTLGSEQFLDSLITTDHPIEVRVAILRDDTTPGGYLWSSSNGPDFTLSSGTLLEASLVIENQRPIELVLPLP